MTEAAIVVYGTPAPQGSKRPLGRTATGKTIIVEASAKTKPWRADVKAACEEWLERHPGCVFVDAVMVEMVFTFLRPASVRRVKRPFPSIPPDLCKLARSTEDAITASGLWQDDKLVVEYTRLAKVYSGEDRDSLQRPGVLIRIKVKPTSIIMGNLVSRPQLEAA